MALASILLAGRLRAQETTPTFRAGVALVKVDAQALDRERRPIPVLTAADFAVYDENVPSRIVYFNREEEPLDLALLLDVSGSMTRSIEDLAAAARASLAPLGPNDRVAVILFARNARVREELTADRAAVADEVRRAVRAQDLGAGTAIYANIVAAAEYLARQAVRGRRAVLVVTDNQSLNYQVTDQDVLRALWGADAVLNAILVGRQRRPDPPRAGAYVNPDFTPSDVFKLAAESGGEAVEAREAGQAFRALIERIRSRYSLHCEAPPAVAGGFRRLRVELTAEARRKYPGAAVKARAGYYAAVAK